MAVRNPLYYTGGNLREMSTAQKDAIIQQTVRQYGLNPSVTMTVVGSGGNLGTYKYDYRYRSGAASTSVSAYPPETTTAEPQLITAAGYSRMSVSASSPTTTDTNNVRYPIYFTGTNIQAMSKTDFLDTFIYPALDILDDSADRDGTYRLHTSTTLTNHTLISATPVFSDTRAVLASFTAAQIGTSGTYQDHPTTITNYYLFRGNAGLTYGDPAIQVPVQATTGGNLQEYSDAGFKTILQEEVRAAAGGLGPSTKRIWYSINGSGVNKGTGMADTYHNIGTGTYTQRFVNADDYRAQEFPDGTPATQSTHYLRIYRY